jgi:cytochrome P450/NADPH-cytochrome P450 reductase
VATLRAEPVAKHDTPLLVLYGSNMGTAEDLASRIAADGEAYGYTAAAAPLDDWVDRLPREGAVVIVTSSYNGRPPDNAIQFCNWLESGALGEDELKGVNYAVFGCGHRDWAATFQAIPRLVDARLAALGATRLYEQGEGDAGGDFFGEFESWYQPLWAQLADTFGLELASPVQQGPLYEVEVITERPANPFVEAFGARSMVVVENRELQNHEGPHPAERSTRHLELVLPDGVTYRAGDHLGVIGRNRREPVQRVANRFGFDESTVIQVRRTGRGKTSLPIDRAIAVYDLLADYVELQEVATQQQLAVLAEHNPCPPEKEQLLALAGQDEAAKAQYREAVLLKRKSLLDLLEEFPACQLPFNLYLEMLPALRPRYYSISSSSLQQKRICSLTVGVVEGPARSGRGRYQGMCSNFLARKNKGDSIYAFVRDTGSDFRLPQDPLTPIIMIGPGTGLAPFRGFLQERTALKAKGTEVGPSLLFFGCRHPEQDFIYEEELKAFVEQGVTELYTAFSRVEPQQKVYVQDRLLEQQERVWTLLEQGAVVYVCGDASRMEPDVRQALVTIYQEKSNQGKAEAQQWLEKLGTSQRYRVDVWASG